jgi:hypothetical protein
VLAEVWSTIAKYSKAELSLFIANRLPGFKFQSDLPEIFQIFSALVAIQKHQEYSPERWSYKHLVETCLGHRLPYYIAPDRVLRVDLPGRQFVLNPMYNLAFLGINLEIRINGRLRVRPDRKLEKLLTKLLINRSKQDSKYLSAAKAMPLINPKFVGGSNQARECFLGITGKKVSRITLPLWKALQFIDSVGIGTISRFFVNSVYSRETKHFSNIAQYDDFESLGFLDITRDVYVYIAMNDELAEIARQLDMADNAGDLFQIPKCCQAFFRDNWESSVKNHGGDLYAKLISDFGKRKISTHRETLFPLNYIDQGYLFHFPCSPACSETINLMQERRIILKHTTYAPSIDYSDVQHVAYKPGWGYGIYCKDNRFYSSNPKYDCIRWAEAIDSEDCILIIPAE